MPDRSGPWVEIADRVFTRRYRFYDQEIGVVLGDGEALVVDTRISERQAREVLDDLRDLTRDPVTIVVDTHWHSDHTFGNHAFRPAAIWGHEHCARGILERGPIAIKRIAAEMPDLADEVAAVTLDPPDRHFSEHARLHVGGRLALDDAIAASPFSPETSRQPLERCLEQLRGNLD